MIIRGTSIVEEDRDRREVGVDPRNQLLGADGPIGIQSWINDDAGGLSKSPVEGEGESEKSSDNKFHHDKDRKTEDD